MATEPTSHCDQADKGFYIPELFLMAIENARERRCGSNGFVVAFLRVQDELALACRECRVLPPFKLFTVADAEAFHKLARSGRMEALREEIFDRYGEYVAVCPRCLKRSLLPLHLPPISLVAQPDDEDGGDGHAAVEAASATSSQVSSVTGTCAAPRCHPQRAKGPT